MHISQNSFVLTQLGPRPCYSAIHDLVVVFGQKSHAGQNTPQKHAAQKYFTGRQAFRPSDTSRPDKPWQRPDAPPHSLPALHLLSPYFSMDHRLLLNQEKEQDDAVPQEGCDLQPPFVAKQRRICMRLAATGTSRMQNKPKSLKARSPQ